ncbi:MAG: TonB-dependent receptor plug domain-containing protein, partial [Chitinophagaceae bacterium]|nr:TonB-dependent receptor plug domain-containing protein [Chitinophagaceae bacterium]
MKLTVFLLIAFIFTASASGVSQTVSYTGTNVKLETIFAEIKKQTDYSVVTSASTIALSKPVNIDVKDVSLKYLLDQVMKDQPLEYEIENKTIIISKKAVKNTPNLDDIINVNNPIKGVVRDAEGNPLGGINIVVKGTKRGVVSDAYGNFMIDATAGQVLIISSVNYGAREITIGASDAPIIVSLEKNISQLDEVQYIAYGTTSRRFSTGNTATVKAADIEKQPVLNPLFALQGRTPGMFITQSTGLTGGAFTVQIQGQNSIGNSNKPLILIDGIPLPFDMPGQFGYIPDPLSTAGSFSTTSSKGNSPISFINPGDILSVDILKDADATAIYGSRAANGAILITTKKGRPGKIKVSAGLQQGSGKVPKKIHLLDTRQYLDMRYEAYKNDMLDFTSQPAAFSYDLLLWDTTRYTDWQKELIGGTAKYTNVTAGLSGGNEYVQYLINARFNKSTTVFRDDFGSEMGNIHLNLTTSSANKRFKLSLSATYGDNKSGVPAVDLTSRIFLAPNAPALYNPDGTLNWGLNAAGWHTFDNPMAASTFSGFEHNITSLISDAQISYTIFPGLDFTSSFGYTNFGGNSFFGKSLDATPPNLRPVTLRASSFLRSNTKNWIVEP